MLAQGCPSTALAFNMHASVVMPLLESAEVSVATKQRVAELVVREHKLIAGNFSEPVTTSLIGERPRRRRRRNQSSQPLSAKPLLWDAACVINPALPARYKKSYGFGNERVTLRSAHSYDNLISERNLGIAIAT